MAFSSSNAVLKGKVVLVTGGLGILGGAIADEVENRGGMPIVSSRSKERVATFNRAAKASGRKVRARLLAFSSEEDVAEVIGEVVDEFGGLHGLVNNAGFVSKSSVPVEKVRWSDWCAAITANVSYAHSCSVAAVDMRDQAGIESIVNIASIYGVIAPEFRIYPEDKDPSAVYYGATKAAVIQLTRYLAAYWGPLGIRVNAVSPGGIAHNQTEPFLSNYVERVPLGRMVDRVGVAAAVCFLLSSDGRFCTGQNIVVDGGQTIW